MSKDPQSKTIRTILEQVFAYGADTLSDVDKPDREQAYENQKKNGIDQALSDISKIIDECRPEPCGITEFDLVVDQYQSNLRKAIK